MILTLNLNCSLDKIYTVDDLPHGGVARAKTLQNTAGGKGLHIANICAILGEDYVVTGFLGGHTGAMIREILDARHMHHDFVPIAGETRSCINIGTPDGKQTEVLEQGPEISAAERESFLQKYEKLLAKADIIVGSGSLPQGLELSFYTELIEMARRKKKKFLLDTSGATLKESLAANPFLIKPNQDEIEMLLQKKVSSLADAAESVRHFLDMGILMPVVSLGKNGAVVGWQGDVYHAMPPVCSVVNAVGSGDAFVAGMAIGLSRELPFTDILRLGSACGAANVLEKESGFVRRENVAKIAGEIQITKI